MFFVMVEISNYRQLARLRASEAADLHGLLEHFCHNRGGRLAREQNGFFLFSFHPLREKVLEQVADFLFLTAESLSKRQEDLFGFSLLLEQEDQADEAQVFNRLKALIFQVPSENRVWAGPRVLDQLLPLFPIVPGEPMSEILGPPQRAPLPPLTVDLLLEMTGWIEALKSPLARQLAEVSAKPGKILRLKGTHLTEKLFVLKTVLHQLYGRHENFPVLFPLEESRDFLSQLLSRVDLERLSRGGDAAEPAWTALLNSRGGGNFPGDSGREDVGGALGHYFRTLIHQLRDQGCPPVFVFLVPHRYPNEAQNVLDDLLGKLVADEGLKLILLEPQEKEPEFLSRHPSLSWTFPALTWEKVHRERDLRGWQDRFPVLSREALESCEGSGMAWVHHLWSLQERRELREPVGPDPSWQLFRSLDNSHHKVYFLLWAGRGLIEPHQLIEFFLQWGEDGAVIEDKVRALGAMGFFPGGVPYPLRPDFAPWLTERLGAEGRELLKGLGEYLFQQWTRHHGLSEVLFAKLRDWGLPDHSETVLAYYLTNKINQGQGDFLSLLRPRLWLTAGNEERAERLRLLAASSKLRYSLNLRQFPWHSPSLDVFRKSFTPRTETHAHGEWQLQTGRHSLRAGDLASGFTLLKRALLEAQSRDDKALEIRAETEIGLALMRKSRTEEGREYFEIASRLAEKTRSHYLVALTCTLDAVALFLLGNLSVAREALGRGLQAADLGGLRKASVFLFFLDARLAFDAGDYAGALVRLDRAIAVANRYRFHEALLVLKAWKGRCQVYAGEAKEGRRTLLGLNLSAERNYYLAEASYFDRDPAAALIYLTEARGLVPPTQPFGWGENIDWRSGYAPIEDRALARPGDLGVLGHQMEAFEALLSGLSGDAAAGDRFPAFLARKALLDLDPASAQVYFWYYLILSKADAKQEAQRLTLLGRSLKDVQTRSSRIEDTGMRQDYLLRPYWNTQFTSEAKKLKLL